MNEDILFEDLYTYTNKYYKDLANKQSKAIYTLSDIEKKEKEQEPPRNTLIPYPGETLIQTLGQLFIKNDEVVYLVNQLFANPASRYSKEDQRDIKRKLKKIKHIINSIILGLDGENKKERRDKRQKRRRRRLRERE